MHIYIKYYNIPGNATDTKHKDWIELESFNLGVNCPSAMVAGKMNDRQYNLPEFIAPTFTKKIDRASGKLFDHATSGEVIPQVIISISGDQTEFLQYTMYNVMITSRNIEALNGAGVIESGTLSYSKISEKHTQTDASGKAQSPFTTGYDLKEAKKL